MYEGLKVVGDALENIRGNGKYVKGLKGRVNFYKECIKFIGGFDISSRLSFDVPTRWNSNHLMLESNLNY